MEPLTFPIKAFEFKHLDFLGFYKVLLLFDWVMRVGISECLKRTLKFAESLQTVYETTPINKMDMNFFALSSFSIFLQKFIEKYLESRQLLETVLEKILYRNTIWWKSHES